MYSIIKTIYINRKINIGVPEKRKLFGERRNDEMSELMTFSLSNKKSRHERYAVRDDVVEMAAKCPDIQQSSFFQCFFQ